MDDFLESITPDELVDLHVGINTCDPSKFRISAHLLSHISDVRAGEIEEARHEAEKEGFGDRLTLAYPNNKSDAWKLLLYWIYNKELEYDDGLEILVDAWLLGDKLGIPAFQDAIMLNLLELHGDIDIEALAYACEMLKPHSKIARFVAEEAVYAVDMEGFDGQSLEMLYEDGMAVSEVAQLAAAEPGMFDLLAVVWSQAECQSATKRLQHYGWGLFRRFEQGRIEGRQCWMEFMVSTAAKRREVRGGAGGPATLCLKSESLSEAVNRVCEEGDMVLLFDDECEQMSSEDGGSSTEDSESEEGETGVSECDAHEVETGEDGGPGVGRYWVGVCELASAPK